MTRLTSTLTLALLAGCVGSRSLKTGQPCPCAPGWSCNTTTNACVAAGNDASVAGKDASASSKDVMSAGDDAMPGTCACGTTVLTEDVSYSYVPVSRDCFCSSAFGFLCNDFEQAAALCSRPEVHEVTASNFLGCNTQFLNVTIGSAAKGRPTYVVLQFRGNSFHAAGYEADLVCNNLPPDYVNDQFLYVDTDGYWDLDPSCGDSNQSWDVCAGVSSGDAGSDARKAPDAAGAMGYAGGPCVPHAGGADTGGYYSYCYDPATTCDGNVCVPCGGAGQACCSNPNGGASWSCSAGLACDRSASSLGTCTDSCGAAGAACCKYGLCQQAPVSLSCTTGDTTGTCGACGIGEGAPCCGATTCPAGLACTLDSTESGLTPYCTSTCGAFGTSCCPVKTCSGGGFRTPDPAVNSRLLCH